MHRFWRRAGEIWCLSWGKGVNRVSDVTGMIDSNMTKMDSPSSALAPGVNGFVVERERSSFIFVLIE